MKALRSGTAALLLISAALVLPPRAAAHCDTLDGPVVAAAELALKSGDVTPVLKWVKKGDEPQIRAAFEQTLKVRSLSPEARALADMYFFETLVRVHRAGEGAPYTGLKAAGAAPEPGIAAADKALDAGSIEDVVKDVGAAVSAGLQRRFARVRQAQPHAEESVEAGRAYVEAYVEFLHYVERLHAAARGPGHPEPAAAEHRD